jgi:hypothetical protein
MAFTIFTPDFHSRSTPSWHAAGTHDRSAARRSGGLRMNVQFAPRGLVMRSVQSSRYSGLPSWPRSPRRAVAASGPARRCGDRRRRRPRPSRASHRS